MRKYSNIEDTTELKLWDDEYPGVVLIVKSGWRNMFHVIVEDPTSGDGDHTHEFLSKEGVLNRYSIDPSLLHSY